MRAVPPVPEQRIPGGCRPDRNLRSWKLSEEDQLVVAVSRRFSKHWPETLGGLGEGGKDLGQSR